MAHTYGMVSLIDDSAGRVLAALHDAGLDNDTIVVFTSDHGELLGDHGLLRKGSFPCRSLLRKGSFPCRSLLRVSCVIRAPVVIATGIVVSSPTRKPDLLPTLVELAGGEVPNVVQGRSH